MPTAEKEKFTPGLPDGVGPGSRKGKRYFISWWSHYKLTIRPARPITHPDQSVETKPGKYATFQRVSKPACIVGTGELGRGSSVHNGTDRNASIWMGLLETDDQEIIDALRANENYILTNQNNRLEHQFRLKELDWNPCDLPSYNEQMRLIRNEPETFGPELAMKKPEDISVPVPHARVGVRRTVVAEA